MYRTKMGLGLVLALTAVAGCSLDSEGPSGLSGFGGGGDGATGGTAGGGAAGGTAGSGAVGGIGGSGGSGGVGGISGAGGVGGTGGNGGVGGAGGVGGDGGVSGASGVGGAGGISGNGGISGASGVGGTGGVSGNGGAGGSLEERFPQVTDWNALEIVYPTMHSGFDGVHSFKVPVRVRCTSGIPVSAWTAEPANAVTFDADPHNQNGAMITIVAPVAEITIGVVSGTRGGKAPLSVTVGTPEQWELGNQRYNNGVDWMLDIVMPTLPPPDAKCSNCHGESSSTGFDIEITPTQLARVSASALRQIFTAGTKPADVDFRVLPPTIMFGPTTYTNAELYAAFHLWDATADQLTGMALYLRSLTPRGEGCVTDPQSGLCIDTDPNLECGD